MKKLLIVIIDYQSGILLEKCLKSIKNTVLPDGWQKEILVIDNNNRNRGFAKGANTGIKKAMENSAEAVLLLNPDTVVDKNFLTPLLNNPADIVGPVIHFKRAGKDVFDYGGKVDRRWGRTRHIELDNCSIVQLFNLDYVSGCAMLIKKPVIEKIGLLNERYFLYFEDVDYCLRAKKAGFNVAVEPKALITHKLKEGREKTLWQRRQLWKSNVIFVNKWISWPDKIFAYGYLAVLLMKLLL